MRVLLTGGAGYVGAHTSVELIEAGYDVEILDNFSNSSPEAVRRIGLITGTEPRLHEADLLEAERVTDIIGSGRFDAIIHFAGLKAVGESVSQPLRYYRTNLVGTLNLVDAMLAAGTRNLVFSSSATVYGDSVTVPIRETSLVVDATNPYGRTKLMIERILEDAAAAHSGLKVARLRYFNPAGAHASGLIGEDPAGIPNNLMPFISQVAVGKRDRLVVFGDDYPTRDGTCIRDYVHVVDLARGHLAALASLDDDRNESERVRTWNLGSGTGYSVMEMIRAFERATGQTIAFDIGPRRAGDIPESYTDPTLASRDLGWRAQMSIDDICRDAWRWQSQNPNGYA